MTTRWSMPLGTWPGPCPGAAADGPGLASAGAIPKAVAARQTPAVRTVLSLMFPQSVTCLSQKETYKWAVNAGRHRVERAAWGGWRNHAIQIAFTLQNSRMPCADSSRP